ncbi:PapB/FocB family fimbrial expression transcriptional regulator [Photobacterium leiognathi]|uniref:PapB/FocB family fimbrial expression transcriptional regulator n=1 Tax=Photobacterium leiognathi TaxID=553611 RepID=UPI002980B310|nr:PapB/FocB family fimbrial expression transcriptional regulator [Photobacterium leiognathi]
MKFTINKEGKYHNRYKLRDALINDRVALKDIVPNTLINTDYCKILNSTPSIFNDLIVTKEVSKLETADILGLFGTEVSEKAIDYFFEVGGIKLLDSMNLLESFHSLALKHINNFSEIEPAFLAKLKEVHDPQSFSQYDLAVIVATNPEYLNEFELSVFDSFELGCITRILKNKEQTKIVQNTIIACNERIAELEKEILTREPYTSEIDYTLCSLSKLEPHEAKRIYECGIRFSGQVKYKSELEFYCLSICNTYLYDNKYDVYFTNDPSLLDSNDPENIRKLLVNSEKEIQSALDYLECTLPVLQFIEQLLNISTNKSRPYFSKGYVKKLIELTNISSDKMICAVIDHLCMGMTQTDACMKNKVKQPNLSRATKKIMNTDDIVHELISYID